MVRDPLARFPAAARLWAAALLCLGLFGKVWGASPGGAFPTSTLILCGDSLCLGTASVPYGGSITLVSQSPIAAPLVIAVGLLVVAAVCPRTPRTKQAARAATVLLAAAAVLATAHSYITVSFPLIGALVIVAPLVWHRPRLRPR